MAIEVRKVKSKANLNTFIGFFTDLYKNCNYASIPLHFDELLTLSKDKNPAHKHCKSQYWVAFRDGIPVGRIAAIINRKEYEKTGEAIACFGWFDFIDNKEVSQALMQTAIDWLKIENITQLHGPLGFSDFDRQGMLIEGFDKPGTFATIYNHAYYTKHMEHLGFSKSTDWVEYEINTEDLSSSLQRIDRLCKYTSERYGFIIFELKSRKQLKKHIKSIFELLNISYNELYGFTQLSKEQIKHYTDMFINLVNLDFLSLVQNSTGKLIGFGLSIPSFTHASQKAKGKLLPLGWYHFLRALKKNDTLDLYLVAVHPDYQNKGVNALLINHTAKNAMKFGIKRTETNIELEDNNKVQNMWRFFDSHQHKRRRCFIKEI